MPAATVYIPPDGNATAYRKQEDAFRNEFTVRARHIGQNLAYYEGRFPDLLKTDNTSVDDNVKVPLIGLLVDKDNAAMMGIDEHGNVEGIGFEISEAEQPKSKGNKPAAPAPREKEVSSEQQYLDDTWKANDKNLLLLKAFRSASLAGHVFIKLLPEEKADPINPTRKLTRLVNLNPANVCVFWKEDDSEQVLWYRIEYSNTRQDIVRNGAETGTLADGWTVYNYTREFEHRRWQLKDKQAWEHEFPPIVDWQNLPNTSNYYGYDDLGVLPALNIAYNFTLSNEQRVIKYAATPRPVIFGDKLPTDKITLPDGTTEETVRGLAPNEILELSTDARMELLQISDGVLVPSQSHAQIIRRALFDSGRELDPASVQDRLGDLTNFALRVLYRDTLAKRQSKWLTAGGGLRKLCQNLLLLGNMKVNSEIKVLPPDPLPQNDMEDAQALKIDVEVFGVSQDTAQEKRGYDPEEEARKNERKRMERIQDETMIAREQGFANTSAIGRRQQRENDANLTQMGVQLKAGNGA